MPRLGSPARWETAFLSWVRGRSASSADVQWHQLFAFSNYIPAASGILGLFWIGFSWTVGPEPNKDLSRPWIITLVSYMLLNTLLYPCFLLFWQHKWSLNPKNVLAFQTLAIVSNTGMLVYSIILVRDISTTGAIAAFYLAPSILVWSYGFYFSCQWSFAQHGYEPVSSRHGEHNDTNVASLGNLRESPLELLYRTQHDSSSVSLGSSSSQVEQSQESRDQHLLDHTENSLSRCVTSLNPVVQESSESHSKRSGKAKTTFTDSTAACSSSTDAGTSDAIDLTNDPATREAEWLNTIRDSQRYQQRHDNLLALEEVSAANRVRDLLFEDFGSLFRRGHDTTNRSLPTLRFDRQQQTWDKFVNVYLLFIGGICICGILLLVQGLLGLRVIHGGWSPPHLLLCVHVSNLILPWADLGVLTAFIVGIANRMSVQRLTYFTAAFVVLMSVWLLDVVVFFWHLKYQIAHWAFSPLVLLFPFEIVVHVCLVFCAMVHLNKVMIR